MDFVAARLHGRRSRLAEAQRLDELCHIQTNMELALTIYPEAEFHTVVDFQRHLVQDLVDELSDLLPRLSRTGAALLVWKLTRFKVENLKVVLRGIVNQIPLNLLQGHLVSLPAELGPDTEAAAAAESLDALVELLPKGTLRDGARLAVEVYGNPPKPFFLEAALDGAYFRELLVRLRRLAGEDLDLIKSMVCHEVDTFHLMLVVRGKFHYGLVPELLLPLHVAGTGIPQAQFISMLAAADLPTAASQAVGLILDTLPPRPSGRDEALGSFDPGALEALAWTRFLRLANAAFRRSHIGLGAVIGYAGIRRVEVANLITLSEGIRGGMAAEVIRRRLIPRTEFEPVYA